MSVILTFCSSYIYDAPVTDPIRKNMIPSNNNINPEQTKETYVHPEHTEIKCWHCGRTFPSRQSCRAHLRACSKRILPRYYRHQNYLFILFCNPLRHMIYGLNQFAKRVPDNSMAFVGALKYLEIAGDIHHFTMIDAASSPEFLRLETGLITRSELLPVLSPENKKELGKVVDLT